jgi:hypothetical protein
MANTIFSTIFIPLLSALLGGVLVAIINNYFEREKRQAEIANLKQQVRESLAKGGVEVEKIQAETKLINAQAAVLATETKDIKDRQEKLEFVLEHLISKPELHFLERLAMSSKQDVIVFNENEYRITEHLRSLRDKGFIKKIGTKSIGELRSGDNLNQFFQTTESGERYFKYSKQLED